jgi:hypothetical protein
LFGLHGVKKLSPCCCYRPALALLLPKADLSF